VKFGVQLACIVLLLSAIGANGQITGDVIGAHDLSPIGTSPTKGALSGSCLYCHAPHSGSGVTPLWNQTLSSQVYTPYTSTTYQQKGMQPPLGASSSLCLSCHDGTVAPGLTTAYGKVAMSGGMYPADQFGSNLQGSHPFSFVLPMKDAPDLVATLVSQGKTGDPTGAVQLVNGNIECTSCHNPHVQAVDQVSLNFLVRDSSNGQMCLACHDPNRLMAGQSNGLAGWATSVHATAANATSNPQLLGSYKSVAQNACISCHLPHNAQGPARLLRGANEQACIQCHNGGSNVSPAAPNVFAEFAKVGHPFSTANNTHDAAESDLLNQNRHSTCADCHDSHAATQVGVFPIPPVLRSSQTGVEGISAIDGVTPVTPAVNQYENCLRCHGTSTGKISNAVYGYMPLWTVSAGDTLNVIPQFSPTATSSHPVTHDRSSAFAQPSLRIAMLNLDGITTGRQMGARILCSDCHNSDDNREFGGTGANGPHGSKFWHILERRYEFSQAPAPGQLITNLFPNPDLSIAGPYSMCSKCHDLSQVLGNSSFTEHARHINDGFSCSTCHTAHGMGAQSGSISGERMVNFDANVVGPNGAVPISYNRATNSCNLTCHSHPHAMVGAPGSKAGNMKVAR
jgi:predicted CXXCH cytochrome family protein